MKISKKTCLFSTLVAVIILAAVEILSPTLKSIGITDTAISIFSRATGAVLFFLIAIYFEHDIIKTDRDIFKKIISVIPCFVIAVNNLPIVALISKSAYISAPISKAIAYAMECLFVALFEEFAFRGVLFLTMIKKKCDTRKNIILSIISSSIIFGMFHIFNLFYGASLSSVLLQVCYSSLIGAMCAYALIKTGCIWVCVAIHAIYNFCGGAVPTLGGGIMLSVAQIIWTTVISVICAVYIISDLFKNEISIKKLYKNNNTEES